MRRWPTAGKGLRGPFFCGCVLGLAMLAPGQEAPVPSRASLGDRGLPGVLGTLSARALPGGEALLAGQGHFLRDRYVLEGGSYAAPGGPPIALDDAFLASLQASLAAGLGLGFQAAAGIPFYYEYLPRADDPGEDQGWGDLSLHLQGGGPLGEWLTGGLFASAWFPTATHASGRLPRELSLYPSGEGSPHRPYGSEAVRAGVGLALTADLRPLLAQGEALVHANLEARRAPAAEGGPGWIKVSLAAESGPWEWFRVAAEYRHERLVRDALKWSRSPGHANVVGLVLAATGAGFGARLGALIAPEDWNPYLPLDLEGGGRAAYRPYAGASLFLSLSWSGFPLRHDQDGDGIADGRDGCPFRAEDRDGFEDGDGCPDPDNDNDNLIDSLDRCPFAGEDRDGFDDGDGCPDGDNDHDGIADAADACGNEAEDRDGHQDGDGCPELDNDRDGIPDAGDRCPDSAETRNGFEDTDGCPETDGDGDGTPDKADRCPHEAEIVNFFQDGDGCPDQKPEPVRSAILRGVTFIAGTAELDKESYGELDSLAALMLAYPGTEIEIQGHLDNRQGRTAVALSEAMAATVAGYLAIKGVDPRRMKPVGYGDSRPVATNRSASGREANRRIEIIRLN